MYSSVASLWHFVIIVGLLILLSSCNTHARRQSGNKSRRPQEHCKCDELALDIMSMVSLIGKKIKLIFLVAQLSEHVLVC